MAIEIKELIIKTNVEKDTPKGQADLCTDLQSMKKEIIDECISKIKELIKQSRGR